MIKEIRKNLKKLIFFAAYPVVLGIIGLSSVACEKEEEEHTNLVPKYTQTIYSKEKSSSDDSFASNGETKMRSSTALREENQQNLKAGTTKRKKSFSLSRKRSSENLNDRKTIRATSSSSKSVSFDLMNLPKELESDSKSCLKPTTQMTPSEDYLSVILHQLEKNYPGPIILFLKYLTKKNVSNIKENKKLIVTKVDKKDALTLVVNTRLPITPMTNTRLSVTTPPESPSSSLTSQLEIEREPPVIDWGKLDINHFIQKLSLFDLSLFQGVSYADLYHFMMNQKKCPTSILNIGCHFTRNVNQIALQIVAAKTEDQRRILISKFLLTGRFLFEKHNFHGTMQIVMALMIPAVRRLLSTNEITNNIWGTISSLIDSKNNFLAYRSLLDKFQDTPTCLPIFSIILSDLTHDYETFESAMNNNNQSAMTSSLEGIAKGLKTFSICQTLPTPIFTAEDENDPFLRLFREYKEVDNEVIDVFSSLRIKWNLGIASDKPTELKDWTPWYFASLLETNGCNNQIEAIFEAGIHNGTDLITYMGNVNQKARLAELGLNEIMINTILSDHL